MVFVLTDQYSTGTLLQAVDLEGQSRDGALLGLASSRQQHDSSGAVGVGPAGAGAAVDEETCIGHLLDQFLCTTSVSACVLCELVYIQGVHSSCTIGTHHLAD